MAKIIGASLFPFVPVPGVEGSGSLIGASNFFGQKGGGILGVGAKQPSLETPGTPTPPDPALAARQADLDRQRAAAAGQSPSTVTNVGGPSGIPTTLLTGDNTRLFRQLLQGL